jgi:hypothetical protein
MPEVIGLTSSETEFEPGMKLEEPSLTHALQILDEIEHSRLHTSISVRTIDLSNQLSITMVTRQDMTIVFRPDYIDQQLERLMQILDRPDFQQRTISSVDLTPDSNVPITFCQNQ